MVLGKAVPLMCGHLRVSQLSQPEKNPQPRGTCTSVGDLHHHQAAIGAYRHTSHQSALPDGQAV